MTDANTTELSFDKDGLISAAIQDGRSGDLLMVGYMNREALATTRATGYVHFWSRSRQKLWKKGETSGHVQRVEEIRVNCELNSLLIEVEQVGAVCHDGYDTCYYRRLESDGGLTIVRDRRFDPRDVYGADGDSSNGIAGLTQRWWSVYEWLRDHDLETQSSTSRRLRAATNDHLARIADELRELAGVLDGSHRHRSFDEDLRLEAGQVLYWVACAAVQQGLTWEEVHPELALGGAMNDQPDDRLFVRLLERRAETLQQSPAVPNAAMVHDTITLVASIVAAHGVEPEQLVQLDLDEMREKPYLDDLFSG